MRSKMINKNFTKEYETRIEYLNNPLSAKEFKDIQFLCKMENTVTYSIVFVLVLIIALSFPNFNYGIILSNLMILVIAAYSIFNGYKSFVSISIEEVTFKSSDSLIGHNTKRHNRLLPSNMSTTRNIYANGTLQHHYFEKLKSFNRPLMRFEIDILNSLKNEI